MKRNYLVIIILVILSMWLVLPHLATSGASASGQNSCSCGGGSCPSPTK